MDLVKVFEEFYLNATTCKSMNSIFIALIPKKNNSIEVSDYCPIKLVTSMYEIVIKVLSLRISEVLDYII